MIDAIISLFTGKQDAPDPATAESPVTQSIIASFLTGTVIKHNIVSYGICRMIVETEFGYAEMAWFDTGNLYDFKLNDKSYPYALDDILLILSAAKHRAEGLWKEEQLRLEAKLKK